MCALRNWPSGANHLLRVLPVAATINDDENHALGAGHQDRLHHLLGNVQGVLGPACRHVAGAVDDVEELHTFPGNVDEEVDQRMSNWSSSVARDRAPHFLCIWINLTASARASAAPSLRSSNSLPLIVELLGGVYCERARLSAWHISLKKGEFAFSGAMRQP